MSFPGSYRSWNLAKLQAYFESNGLEWKDENGNEIQPRFPFGKHPYTRAQYFDVIKRYQDEIQNVPVPSPDVAPTPSPVPSPATPQIPQPVPQVVTTQNSPHTAPSFSHEQKVALSGVKSIEALRKRVDAIEAQFAQRIEALERRINGGQQDIPSTHVSPEGEGSSTEGEGNEETSESGSSESLSDVEDNQSESGTSTSSSEIEIETSNDFSSPLLDDQIVGIEIDETDESESNHSEATGETPEKPTSPTTPGTATDVSALDRILLKVNALMSNNL